jgi:hypothetical protein
MTEKEEFHISEVLDRIQLLEDIIIADMDGKRGKVSELLDDLKWNRMCRENRMGNIDDFSPEQSQPE